MGTATMTQQGEPIRSRADAEARAWDQVAGRDGSARFLYGVRSTGIFCRPTCPSRRPARRNVVFFRDAKAALMAGFRACLRCRPVGIAAEANTVAKVCAHLGTNLDRKVTLGELAALTGVSPFTVQRLFQRVLGVSPQEYQRELRAQALRRELADPEKRVTDAIYDAGYSSSSRAYEDVTKRLGMSPRAYRGRGRGEQIGFATADSPLGRLMVAATSRGLCSVMMGANDSELMTQLRAQFPEATFARAESELESTIAQVVSQMTEHPAAIDLALDIRATAFQTRVWQALREIPRGETRSYGEVAEALGNPKAVRAVARACASNPVAVVIPCHRVVGSNGKLTGYRWGLERKKKLLEQEAGQ
jgi:AraC family transcriptional regulator of adaptative response/methylated-DNA-[protein]-cysteine methyltransferase